MIGMTEKAASKMKDLLATGVTATAGIRIDVRGDPCQPSYRFALVDRPVEGDFRIEEGGIRIYFHQSHVQSLFNVEIDHDGSAGASGFMVRRTAPCG